MASHEKVPNGLRLFVFQVGVIPKEQWAVLLLVRNQLEKKERSPSRDHFWESLVIWITLGIGQNHLSIEAHISVTTTPTTTQAIRNLFA